MDILSYLAEVVQTHREVGIPELGTFFKKKLPGRYDAAMRSFIPPSFQLEYTTEVTEDVLLAKYISQRHHISIESAVYHIDLFVANLKEKLGEEKEIDLKQLGRFVLIDGELIYEPHPKLNLGLKYFGLPDTAAEIIPDTSPAIPEEKIEPINVHETVTVEAEEQLEAITQENNLAEENPGNVPTEEIYQHEPEEEMVQTIEPIIPPVAVESIPLEIPTKVAQAPQQPVVPAAIVTEPEPINYQLETPDKVGSPIYLILIISLLTILIVGLGLFLWKPEFFKSSAPVQNGMEATPVPNAIEPAPLATDTAATNDTVAIDTPKKVVAVPDVAAKDTNPVPATVTPAVVSGPVTYEVIGSSVYSEKEAEYFIHTMKRKWGLAAKIVSKRPGKKIKISIASYKDEKTARAERTRLEEKINIPGLYIYVNTNKPE